ncbi:uncharacterized protein LOC116262901 [Nymphaea colorata]|uniref:Uncharacterized protein n=1 Tax=Nymphaea colorata TaxID=210225 RepID=A0A5K0WV97_9MAGN|nr:uncharacterized protein LOC116262901 [Nymphaea colorata]
MFSHHQKAEKANPPAHEESHRGMEHEIKELIHHLTGRLSDLHNHHPSKSHHPSQQQHHGGHGDDHDPAGLKVIALTGNNNGASMKAGRDEVADTRVSSPADGEAVAAYANSNFQAVNNSVVVGGSCTANDPGIHLDIPIETLEPEWQHEEYMKMKKKDKKQKKKDKKEKKKKKKEKKSDASFEDGGENKKMQEKKSSSSESSSSSSSSSEDEGKH